MRNRTKNREPAGNVENESFEQWKQLSLPRETCRISVAFSALGNWFSVCASGGCPPGWVSCGRYGPKRMFPPYGSVRQQSEPTECNLEYMTRPALETLRASVRRRTAQLAAAGGYPKEITSSLRLSNSTSEVRNSFVQVYAVLFLRRGISSTRGRMPPENDLSTQFLGGMCEAFQRPESNLYRYIRQLSFNRVADLVPRCMKPNRL